MVSCFFHIQMLDPFGICSGTYQVRYKSGSNSPNGDQVVSTLFTHFLIFLCIKYQSLNEMNLLKIPINSIGLSVYSYPNTSCFWLFYHIFSHTVGLSLHLITFLFQKSSYHHFLAYFIIYFYSSRNKTSCQYMY